MFLLVSFLNSRHCLGEQFGTTYSSEMQEKHASHSPQIGDNTSGMFAHFLNNLSANNGDTF